MATLQECSLYTPTVSNISCYTFSLFHFSFVCRSHCTHLLHVFRYRHILVHFLSTERNANIIPCTKILYLAPKCKHFGSAGDSQLQRFSLFFILQGEVPLPSQKPNQRVKKHCLCCVLQEKLF